MAEEITYRKVDMYAIIDRSGSMDSIKTDVIGGFNSFLTEQQTIPGEATLTYVQFDDKYDVVYDSIDIKDVVPLDNTTFVPRGMTALFDAIYKTIGTIKQKYSTTITSEIPGILVMIMTDGLENASKEVTSYEQIKKLIEECRGYGWEFVFLAANQDAFANAGRMGMSYQNTSNYVATSGYSGSNGIIGTMKKMSKGASKFRTKGLSSMDYSSLLEDEDDNKDLKDKS